MGRGAISIRNNQQPTTNNQQPIPQYNKMNEQTETNINEAIDWLQQTGGSIQDFATEQAPLYCREVVAWELWHGAAFAAAGLVMLIFAAFAFKNLRKAFAPENKADSEVTVPGWFFATVIPAVLGTVLILVYGSSAIKAAVAPRVVIVEHLRGLSK